MRKENWQLAIHLQEHIRYFQPKSWIVPIHDVDFAPSIGENDYARIVTLHSQGKLKEFDTRWYVIAAIEDFFNKGLDEKE